MRSRRGEGSAGPHLDLGHPPVISTRMKNRGFLKLASARLFQNIERLEQRLAEQSDPPPAAAPARVAV